MKCDSRGLSPREEQVAQLLLEGQSHRQIAAILGIALGTVKIHAASVRLKRSLIQQDWRAEDRAPKCRAGAD